VNAEVLDNLAKEYPIAEKIVTYRHYSKLLSTYVEGLLELASEKDRIHTSYNQSVTSTGRLSSTNPNLQNIPAGDSFAGEIRSAFVPDSEEDSLIAFDYSQVEVRLLAIMSGDDNLLSAFRDNRDIHQVTAELIFGKKDISGVERRFAKAVNF
jgi:DNA polymerase-1